jgi:hypothetical protein
MQPLLCNFPGNPSPHNPFYFSPGTVPFGWLGIGLLEQNELQG